MIPMDGHTTWVPSQYDHVLPLLKRKMPGPPKKKRKYTDAELLAPDTNDSSKISRIGRIMTCKSCKQEGHNARTCALRKKKQVCFNYCVTYIYYCMWMSNSIMFMLFEQDGAGTSNGGAFKGVGVYTNSDTGRTVIHVSSIFVHSK
ncbi:hypothetical protein LINGRAPRIM_LOCUS2677 [Linum grandiflorum]